MKQNRDTILDVPPQAIPPPLPCCPLNPLLSDEAGLQSSALLFTQEPHGVVVDGCHDHPSSNMVGKLYAMCSPEEMLDKQHTSTANDLERLNFLPDPDTRMVNSYLAMKSFQRSDASKLFRPPDIRPAVWCRRCVHAMLAYFVCADIFSPEAQSYLYPKNGWYSFSDVYSFMRDRLRAVWQDLTVQHCTRHRAYIECLEISLRFLVLSEELLCDRTRQVFDSVQNNCLMTTCLDKLLTGYADVRHTVKSSGQSQDSMASILVYKSPNEGEFWSYRLVLSLASASARTFIDIYANLPEELLENPLIQLASRAHHAFRTLNITRYFKLLNGAPVFLSILLRRFANMLRTRYLHQLILARLHKQRMPLKLFMVQFGFTSDCLAPAVEFIASFQMTLVTTNGDTVHSDRLVHGGLVDVSTLRVSLLGADVPVPRELSTYNRSRVQRVQDPRLIGLVASNRRQQLLDPSFPLPCGVAKGTLMPPMVSTVTHSPTVSFPASKVVAPSSPLELDSASHPTPAVSVVGSGSSIIASSSPAASPSIFSPFFVQASVVPTFAERSPSFHVPVSVAPTPPPVSVEAPVLTDLTSLVSVSHRSSIAPLPSSESSGFPTTTNISPPPPVLISGTSSAGEPVAPPTHPTSVTIPLVLTSLASGPVAFPPVPPAPVPVPPTSPSAPPVSPKRESPIRVPIVAKTQQKVEEPPSSTTLNQFDTLSISSEEREITGVSSSKPPSSISFLEDIIGLSKWRKTRLEICEIVKSYASDSHKAEATQEETIPAEHVPSVASSETAEDLSVQPQEGGMGPTKGVTDEVENQPELSEEQQNPLLGVKESTVERDMESSDWDLFSTRTKEGIFREQPRQIYVNDGVSVDEFGCFTFKIKALDHMEGQEAGRDVVIEPRPHQLASSSPQLADHKRLELPEIMRNTFNMLMPPSSPPECPKEVNVCREIGLWGQQARKRYWQESLGEPSRVEPAKRRKLNVLREAQQLRQSMQKYMKKLEYDWDDYRDCVSQVKSATMIPSSVRV